MLSCRGAPSSPLLPETQPVSELAAAGMGAKEEQLQLTPHNSKRETLFLQESRCF